MSGSVLIRLANIDDAEQLFLLNLQFNGKDETTLQHIQQSLKDNQQEIIAVAEVDHHLVGFLCIQLKRSFCYDACISEITELFVQPEYRRKRIASNLILFIETHCKETYTFTRIELLTGKKNRSAQGFYHAIDYMEDDELHLVKLFEV